MPPPRPTFDPMPRFRPLDPPHKGLRHLLGLLALEAGRTDYSDPAEVGRLQDIGQLTFDLLADHAHTEDVHVLEPLEERAPGAAGALEADHVAFHERELELRSALAALDDGVTDDQAHDLYLSITAFQADYLRHLLLEETVVEPIIWQHFTDEELIADQVEIGQAMSPETLLAWFRAIAPARTVSENRQVVSDFAAAAPPEATAAVLATLRAALSADRYEALVADLPGLGG